MYIYTYIYTYIYIFMYSDFSSRVNAIIIALRADRARHMHLNFIREGIYTHKYIYVNMYIIMDRLRHIHVNFIRGGLYLIYIFWIL
jgi:hypothetical protein